MKYLCPSCFHVYNFRCMCTKFVHDIPLKVCTKNELVRMLREVGTKKTELVRVLRKVGTIKNRVGTSTTRSSYNKNGVCATNTVGTQTTRSSYHEQSRYQKRGHVCIQPIHRSKCRSGNVVQTESVATWYCRRSPKTTRWKTQNLCFP